MISCLFKVIDQPNERLSYSRWYKWDIKIVNNYNKPICICVMLFLMEWSSFVNEYISEGSTTQ